MAITHAAPTGAIDLTEWTADHVGSASSFGAPTIRTIAAGVVDVTGLSYVILKGEAAADDILDEITGGVDGQVVLFEQDPDGTVIHIGNGSNFQIVSAEADESVLGEFVSQVTGHYSATEGGWFVWSEQPPASVMSEDGNTEIIMSGGLDPYIDGQVDSDSVFMVRSFASGVEPKGFIFYVPATLWTGVPADADLVAGYCAMYFDSTNGAAKVKFKGKSADGTVVTGEVALT